MFVERSHTMTFQSFDDVSMNLEFLDQLQQIRQPKETSATPVQETHSTLVTALMCPSSQRTGERVSRSHKAADPSFRPATMNRPEGSNLVRMAPETREVCTAVG